MSTKNRPAKPLVTRRPPVSETTLRPRGAPMTPVRLVPDPTQPPPFVPAELGELILTALCARYPHTQRVQWNVTLSWSTNAAMRWRAETFHPNATLKPFVVSGEDAPQALQRLLDEVRR